MISTKGIQVLCIICLISIASAQQTVQGTVFLDLNANGLKDTDEAGIAKILVSNGREVVQTNQNGLWLLPLTEDSLFFVIKPANYATALNENQIPQHYQLLRSSEQKNDLSATQQPLPIDFPLYSRAEPARFSVLIFGDPQARGIREVNFITHDVVEECIGTKALFGITLGDIVADDPNLFAEISQSIGKIGIPWYYLFGNHDSDRQATSNADRDNTFEHYFGPSTYAFEFAGVVFIALNNIIFNSDGKYRPGFTDQQIAFIANYLPFIPDEKLVVLLMHVPIVACKNREAIFRLIEKRPNSLSVSSHLHEQLHVFIDKKFGWQGSRPHHHYITATVSGSWWCGMIDEVGIPHATMNDGAPNGYSVITFDSTSYFIKFKAARRPADYQMNIYLPDDLSRAALDTVKVLVNVFAGSEKSIVEMTVDQYSDWKRLDPVVTTDPEILRMYRLSPVLDEKFNEQALEEIFGWKMDYPSNSRHMWQGTLPPALSSGTHCVMIRTTDMFGQSYEAQRIFRVSE
jgi:hypothetical protein